MKQSLRILVAAALTLAWSSLARAQTCTFTLSTNNQSFSAAGGTATFNVNTTTNCDWTVSNTVPWITITGGASGAGTGTVSYSVATNTSATGRSGALIVGDETNSVINTVTQDGAVTQVVLRAVICPVKLKGVLTYGDDEDNLVRAKVGKRDIVSDPDNRLALDLDQENSTLRLIEIDSDNDEVAELAVSTRCAFLPGNLFAGDLIFDALPVFNETLDLDFEGDGTLQVRGSFTVTTNGLPDRVSGKLLGVINDPVNGNFAEPAAMFKGILSPDGRGFSSE
jgi:hypothetical protein